MTVEIDVFDNIETVILFHPIYIKLKQKFATARKFVFKPIAEETFKNIAKNLSEKKADSGNTPLHSYKSLLLFFLTL